MRIALVSLFSVLLLGALAAPVAAQVTTPDEWEGIWTFTNVTRDCDSGDIISQSTSTEPLCAAEVVDFTGNDEDFPGECIGEIGPNGGTLSCTGSQELPGGFCSLDFAADIEVTVSGDSFSGVITLNLSYEGLCGPVTDTCTETTVTGTRVGPVTSECSVPVDNLSWGAAKARY